MSTYSPNERAAHPARSAHTRAPQASNAAALHRSPADDDLDEFARMSGDSAWLGQRPERPAQKPIKHRKGAIFALIAIVLVVFAVLLYVLVLS